MRRNRVLLFVIGLSCCATLFLTGLAIGYWVLPDSQGPSLLCLVVQGRVQREGLPDLTDKQFDETVEWYNDNCR